MVEDIVTLDATHVRVLHEDILAESEVTSAGIRSPGAIESAITYVTTGYFGESPSTVHETATHLMRLLVAEHPFVDGNKRTGLNAAAVLYDLNGYDFAYDDETVRSMLKAFGTDLDAVDVTDCVHRCRHWATAVDDTWSDDPDAATVTGRTDERDGSNRGHLRERARSVDGAERRRAIRQLGALERERNAVTYERLAHE